ncbi:MAG: SpoIIE family protein phosphatase [Pseudomonadota bacterium]
MTPRNHRPRNSDRRRDSRDILTRILDMLLLVHHGEAGLKSRWDLARCKLGIISSNILANVLGLAAMRVILSGAGLRASDYGLGDPARSWALVLVPIPFLVGIVLTVWYERPVWKCTDSLFHQTPVPEEVWIKARRRALNEPFFVVLLDLGLWLGAGTTIAAVQWASGAPAGFVQIPFFAGLNAGLIISACAFFFTEHVVQFHLTPYIFPQGDLSRESHVGRIRIPTRLLALMLAINVVPFFSQILLLNMLMEANPGLVDLAQHLRPAMTVSAAVFIVVGFIVTIQAGINMSIPFHDILRVLRLVREGRYDQRVTVSSNDEIGYTAEAVNEMAQGLEDRERMSRSIDLAREVQQNLMPSRPPRAPGLDLAGRSIFCDRTGGDYFDYMELRGHDSPEVERIAVVIGDVSDHGLHAAMLMVSVRAYLRRHLYQSEDLSYIAGDVNRHLAGDVKDSGHFMTALLVILDPAGQKIRWIRAGHDPGMIYEPDRDRFEELGGAGAALGLDEKSFFPEYSRGVRPGQILVLATDGVWEARDPDGRPFGKDRLMAAVRENASSSAEEILEEVLVGLRDFCAGRHFEDDVSLVIIKITD